MMARSSSSTERPDRLTRTAPTIEQDSPCNAGVVHRSAASSALPLPSLHPRAASSSSTPRRCTAIRMTAIPWAPSLPTWRSSLASRPAASMSTRGTAAIRREMRRRAAVEPVIGHLKAEHRMGRNYLTGPEGDRINTVLAAAGYNFHLLLRWLAEILRACMMALTDASRAQTVRIFPSAGFFTADYFPR